MLKLVYLPIFETNLEQGSYNLMTTWDHITQRSNPIKFKAKQENSFTNTFQYRRESGTLVECVDQLFLNLFYCEFYWTSIWGYDNFS